MTAKPVARGRLQTRPVRLKKEKRLAKKKGTRLLPKMSVLLSSAASLKRFEKRKVRVEMFQSWTMSPVCLYDKCQST